MRVSLLAVAIVATIAISSAVDDECIQRKLRALPVHWPNPTDCSSFYRCTNKNIKRKLLCPEGKEYNSKTGRCAIKGKSRCQLSLRAPLAKTANNSCASKISGTFLPDPNSCRGFIICNDNLAYPQTCDAGSYYNSETSACEPDAKKVCWENLCVKEANGIYVPAENDCYSFYICYDEKPVAQNCPSGSYFNAEILNCHPGKCPAEETTTYAPELSTTTCISVTATTPCTAKSTTTCASKPTTTCAPVTTTKPCATPTTTTTTCTPESTTTTCAPVTTTTPCPSSTTTTTTCTPQPTTTTCAPEPTTTTPCPSSTTTTTCTPKTTTTTCTPEATTTTCAPETTTTPCPSSTTTTTCTPKTTTITCAPEPTTTTCVPVTTTTACSAQETTTPAHDDCSNPNCNSSKCKNAKYGFAFPAQNTSTGFCVCVKEKPEYHECPQDTIFNESYEICVPASKSCPESKCSNVTNYSIFPATNTTAGFCRCVNGRSTYYACVGSDYVYDRTLGFCVKSNLTAHDCNEQPTPATKLCKGGFKEGDFLPDPSNCMFLYICYDGELVESSCGRGNYYNDKIKACMPDTQGKCAACHQPPVSSVGAKRHKRSVRENCVEGSKTPAADCDKYYKCSGGFKLLYGCGRDNFFNVTTLSCQLDVDHVCCPVNSCTEDEKTPYPEDTAKYYQCIEGRQVLLSCGPNSYFNKLSATCVSKRECTCPGGYKEGEISAHPTDCDKFYICIDGEQVLEECGKGNYFNNKTLCCEKDVKNTCNVEKPCLCPGGYEDGELSAHPTDCDKYYICIHGKQELESCGKYHYFDNSTLTCEPDIYNECWSKTEVCTCPGGYEEGDFSAHPTDCSKYYICHDGRQVLEDCGTNNYFNNDTLSCAPDVYHVCWPNLCTGQPNGALVANPQQCNAFFLCENNEGTAKACFEGQWFDPGSSACVADLKAVCYNPCANENNGPVVLLPHPICNEYYFCNGGKTFVGTCQVGRFDIATGVCNSAEKCFPNPCDNSSVSAFPDPYDPAKFYWCNGDRKPIPGTCPSGMEFNLEYKMCKKVSDPDCPACLKDGYFPTVYGNDETEFCVCVDSLATKIECPKDYVFSLELGTCYSNAPCDPSFCLDAKEYDTAPNRNDSKSFCMCFNKKPTIIKCPNNGTFNPYTLECSDYEISPECLQTTCVGEKSNSFIFKPINAKTNNGFCQCINQIATFKPCNYGSTFNPDLLICQLAEINCNSYQCRGLADNTIIPAVTTTAGYCECVAGVATYYNCPNDGEFNVTSNKCDGPLCDLTRCTTLSGPDGPFAASIPNGFCMCNIGYIPCPTDDTLFSERYGNCINPCPQMLCDGRPDKYLVSSLINRNSFCVCHGRPSVPPTYEICPSESFVFDEGQQRCIANSEELCGTALCKSPGTFEAKDTLSGFCLCTDVGKQPTFEECLEGIFVPDKNACLPTAKDVCDISLCAEATIDHPITLPANNSILEFCYCSSPTNAMLLPCPYGKYYNPAKGMCISQIEDCSKCPNGIEEGEKVADTTTCNKYSICVDGSLEPETCAEGDYFNVDMNDCVPDTQGVCSRKSNSCTCLGIYYENELLAHPVNPQMYYACQGNTLLERKCAIGRIFSAAQKQCIAYRNIPQKRSLDFDIDPEFGCSQNEKRSVPSNCSQYEICLQQTWQRRTCSNYRYYNPEQRKCLQPRDDFVCSYAKVTTLPTCNENMEEYLLQSGRSCRQYYRCQDGKWRLKTCGRQHYFNVQKSTCLPVPQGHLFTCDLLRNNTTEEDNRERETPACQHLSQRFYAKNCAMYLICLDNDWWYQYCPNDMYYNRILNYCLRDTHRQCADVRRTAEINANAEEFSKEPCQQDGLLRPSAKACNRYFICLNAKWQMQHCSLGEFYDVSSAKCTADIEGVCGQLNKDCLPGERRSIPRNCSSYEECTTEGKWRIMTCPQNEIFDELLQQCIINQGLCSKHGLKRTCRHYETLPVNHNCSMFYYCSQDAWSLGNCLKGFMYSIQKEMCVAHMPQNSCQPRTLETALSGAIDTAPQKRAPCEGKIDATAISHPTDCSRYYICIQESLSHEMQCSAGSYFESSLGYCRPNDGNCRLPLSGVCANATYEALVPHPSECQSYYKCSSINGTELLHCPEGQYFQNLTGQCLVDHGECKNHTIPEPKCIGHLKHGTRLVHEIYCNIYYACVKGLAIPVECPDNYWFNSILSKCVPNKNRECHEGHLTDGNVTYNCNNLSDGTYFPDHRDCTRYYICFQGQASPKKCANSSYFDSELLLCMPDDSSCPFVNDDKGQYNPVPPHPLVCEGKHGHLMADPLNCNNFYACIHNKLKHERCYSQQFFNTTSQQCQQKVELEKNSVPAKTIKVQCQDEITTIKQLCSELTEGTSLAEPGDCRRYITCQNSGEEPISQRCRNGEIFDSLLGFCRQNDGTCLLENGQRVGECTGKHGQLARDASDCRSYFICINGQKIPQTCGQDEYFNQTQNMCVKDTQQVCKPNQSPLGHVIKQSCVGLSEFVLYPYIHDNCRSYFQCIKGLATVHKCADDLYFDPVAIKCTKNKTECVMPTQAVKRSPAFGQEFAKLCSGKKFEYPYANVDNDCRSFYICHANGDVSHELCPLGMIFNKQLIMCTAENKTSCTLS